MSLKVIGFVTDDVAIRENEIQHFAIVESGDSSHKRPLRIDIPAHMYRSRIDAEVRERVILQ